jgi:hypothetical protein
MVEVQAESMVGGTIFHREMICVRFPESWSSTSLATKAVPGTAQGIFVLDTAFVLIEGHPRFFNSKSVNKKKYSSIREMRPPAHNDA